MNSLASNPTVVLAIFVGLALAGLAIWLGERLRGKYEALILWERVACGCLLFAGATSIALAAVTAVLMTRPLGDQQGYGMLFGFLLGVPCAVAAAIGVFLVFLLIRGDYVRSVLLPLLAAFPIVRTFVPREPWSSLATALLSAGVVFASWWRWRALSRMTPKRAPRPRWK